MPRTPLGTLSVPDAASLVPPADGNAPMSSMLGPLPSEVMLPAPFTTKRPTNCWEVAPTADLYSAYSASDRRRDITLGKDGGDYEGLKIPTTIGAEDLHVIRYGEVVLTKAEALARLNRLPEAVAEYNKIRVRAGLTPHVLGTDVTSQTDVLNAIWNERRLELALEGDRWPDLVRTGRAMSVLELPANRAFQLLYPIPSRELIVSPGLTQNPGY